jgi:hypothetical protein
MRLDLAAIDEKERNRIGPRLLGMLLHSPFRRTKDWSRACVVHHPGRIEIIPRAQAIGELLSAGATSAAHECRVRRVRHGEVLIWLVKDTEEHAIAGLVVVDLLPSRAR